MHDPSRWHEKIWRYHPIDFPPEAYYQQNEEFIDKIISLGEQILEVGCGTALASIAIKMKYPEKHVVAIDINPIVVHMARTRIFYWRQDIKCGCIDAFKLPFSDQSFDVIFSEGLLEHYEEEEIISMLREHLRVAKYVVLQVPLAESLVLGTGYGDEIGRSEDEFINIFSKVGEIIDKSVHKGDFVSVIKRMEIERKIMEV